MYIKLTCYCVVLLFRLRLERRSRRSLLLERRRVHSAALGMHIIPCVPLLGWFRPHAWPTFLLCLFLFSCWFNLVPLNTILKATQNYTLLVCAASYAGWLAHRGVLALLRQ